MPIHFPHRRALALLIACLLAFAAAGCSRKKHRAAESSPMGSPVYVGPLTVTALEADWKEKLDTDTGAREPKNRFLIIRITATNGGGAEAALPLLSLVDAKGNSYLEEDKGEGVPEWLGLLRVLKPAQTEDGRLIFDVPPGSYKLRVSTGGDPEQEMSALIDIPFKLESVRPDDLITAPQPDKK